MSSNLRNRVYQVVSDVMDVPVDSITNNSSPDTIAAWDSATHINLILALEAEFGVPLSDEDALDMLSVRLIETILAERIAAESVQDKNLI